MMDSTEAPPKTSGDGGHRRWTDACPAGLQSFFCLFPCLASWKVPGSPSVYLHSQGGGQLGLVLELDRDV